MVKQGWYQDKGSKEIAAYRCILRRLFPETGREKTPMAPMGPSSREARTL